MSSNQHVDTRCVQAGWQPKNGESRVLPVIQSTTFKYDSAEFMGKLFDLQAVGHFYTRLSNPTLEAVENKIAALEGGIAAMVTSSGQAATFYAVLNLCQSGDHFVSTTAIYGGTYNLFAVTLKRMGIEVSFVDQNADDATIAAAFRPNTKLLFAETLANPALEVADLEKLAKIAHDHKVPLVVDNTFPTPVLCRPFEWGADIVIHSTTKYMDGHAQAVGGVIVDSGKFDWKNGNFPEFTTPDPSYHGVVYADTFGSLAYIVKARVQLMRDLGAQQNPFGAYLLNLGLETLHLRMPRHVQNGQAVAEFLEKHPKVASVNYPGLPSNRFHQLAKKYLPDGTCGVVSFEIKGTKEDAMKFMDSLKLVGIVTHVADARSCVQHPSSTTHRQLTDEQMKAAGVTPQLIRLSIGIEHPTDILADIDQALSAI